MENLGLLTLAPVVALGLLFVMLLALLSRLSGPMAPVRRSREEVCRTIEEFVDGGGEAYAWDDFVSFEDADPVLERVRQKCEDVGVRFPAEGPYQWCGPKGMEELRRIARELRAMPER